MAITMPPLIEELPGTVWIRLHEGSWNISTWVIGQRGSDELGEKHTVSLLFVFGTAISNWSSAVGFSAVAAVAHWANEQKFMVFTMRIWSSHGCFLGSGGVSTGRTTLIVGSSSSENFHTISL
jgi:hypothetical protein